MGNCKYCGKSAGLLRNVHEECEKIYDSGKLQIMSLIRKAVQDTSSLNSLKVSIKDIAQRHLIKGSEVVSIIIDGWELAVEIAFEDGVLAEEEETNLFKVGEYFGFTQEHLDRNGAYTKVIRGAVLRQVMNGEIPERIKVTGNFPFNLQKNEIVVWIFQGVKYFEQQTRTHFQGGSVGASIRVAKGVYFRTGGFRGHPVKNNETVHADTGVLAFTNKHLYFAGNNKSFRIPYKKIVSFQPYSDGIGIQRDAASAKPQSFITGDGWFSYNLLTNLASME